MATPKQKLLLQKLIEKAVKGDTKPMLYTMLECGYSRGVAKTPDRVLESKGMRELMEQNGMDDASLTNIHKSLLQSARLDHMTFPLGPKIHENEADAHLLSDTDIRELLLEVNCVSRRIVHGETARHVYFWSPDNKARQASLDMAYKLKGSYAPVKSAVLHGGHITVTEKQQRIADKYADELKKTFIE